MHADVESGYKSKGGGGGGTGRERKKSKRREEERVGRRCRLHFALDAPVDKAQRGQAAPSTGSRAGARVNPPFGS